MAKKLSSQHKSWLGLGVVVAVAVVAYFAIMYQGQLKTTVTPPPGVTNLISSGVCSESTNTFGGPSGNISSCMAEANGDCAAESGIFVPGELQTYRPGYGAVTKIQPWACYGTIEAPAPPPGPDDPVEAPPVARTVESGVCNNAVNGALNSCNVLQDDCENRPGGWSGSWEAMPYSNPDFLRYTCHLVWIGE